MISIDVFLVALALGGAPGEVPLSPSPTPASSPGLDAAAPLEHRLPRRRATAFIRGRVVSWGAPVAYAHVEIRAYRLGGMADEHGAFTITRVPAGVCTLQILGPGGHPRCLPIVVADPGLDSLEVAIDAGSPLSTCNPWFEVDPRGGDDWASRDAPCGNGNRGSTIQLRKWGSLSIDAVATACEVTIRWTWWGRGAPRLTVRDSSGAVIRTLVELDPSGPANFDRGGVMTWDGTRDDGAAVTAGKYRVRLEDDRRGIELIALSRRYVP